jgi:diketogulonate reductase-like aldo/keto reductase
MEATLATAEIPPVVNQVKFHPYSQHQDLVPKAKSKRIATAAFRSLNPIRKARQGPCDAVLAELSKRYGASEEAILLRWCVDRDVAAVATSHKEERLKVYLGVTKFSLTPEAEEIITKKSLNPSMNPFLKLHPYWALPGFLCGLLQFQGIFNYL